MAENAPTTTDIRLLLEGQSSVLVQAMRTANNPIEHELRRINAHLERLNGQVAKHAEMLAKGGAVIDSLKEDIDRIDGDERRALLRRDDDVAAKVAVAMTAAVKEKEDSGENRRLTMFHLYIALGCIAATVGVLKMLGLLK